MATPTNRSILICSKIVTLENFIENFNTYFPMVVNRFRPSTLSHRSDMGDVDFAKFIFNKLYSKPDFSVSLNETRSAENKILEDIGIDVISYSSNKSKIIFNESKNMYTINSADLDSLISSIKKSIKYVKKDLHVAFGIELEFIAMHGCRQAFNAAMHEKFNDKYVDLCRYNHNDGNRWILGKDISIHNRMRGYSGYELTSPILHFNEHDLNELESVIKLIKDVFHGTVNNSCGTHIHMSFNCGMPITEHLCKHFARSYARNESTLFDKLVPKSRREDNSRWCRHTSVIHYRSSRYRKLNFSNVNYYNQNTELHLEFRQLNGTLDFDKIKSWIKLQKLFVQIALNSYNESHTELRDCIRDVVKMPIEEVVCAHELTEDEVESLLKESKLIS